uniref:Uncharacterized protein n=1 Tax=Salvator merianae TaxID=96440 RepID=A0A8D0DRG4_SALMN
MASRTGQIGGGQCYQWLLPAGYQMTVLMWDPTQLPWKGDKPTIKGQNTRTVILGTHNDLSPTTVMSEEGTRNFVMAMKAHGICKEVVCLSTFLIRDLDKIPYQAASSDQGS